jgi:hypothetical protein
MRGGVVSTDLGLYQILLIDISLSCFDMLLISDSSWTRNQRYCRIFPASARRKCAKNGVLCWRVVCVCMRGHGRVWIRKMIFAICAFECAELVYNEMCVDSNGVLEGSRYRGVLQEPVFDSCGGS